MRQVHWALSRHARRLLTLALAGLLTAVITRRPEFAGAAAPAVLLLAALRPGRPGEIRVDLRLTANRLVEQDEAAVVAVLNGQGGYIPEFRLSGSEGVTPGEPRREGSATWVPFRVGRWGRRPLGTLEIVLRDRWRLAEGTVTLALPLIECSPRPARVDRGILLRRLPSLLGEHTSRRPGEGIEFTGVREFVPGDRQRRINWPATTRRGSLQLNTFTAERGQNVVVIADASADVGEAGSSSVDLAFRAAAGLARTSLAARDRVGLILFGRRLAWLAPGTGERQFRRMMALLVAGPSGPERAGALARLPRAALPPGALILVFSALLDHQLVEALRDLRERGFTVLVVDVLNVQPSRQGRISDLTWRIWRLEQDAIRFSLRQLGIPTAHWDGHEPLDTVLAGYTRRPVGGPS